MVINGAASEVGLSAAGGSDVASMALGVGEAGGIPGVCVGFGRSTTAHACPGPAVGVAAIRSARAGSIAAHAIEAARIATAAMTSPAREGPYPPTMRAVDLADEPG